MRTNSSIFRLAGRLILFGGPITAWAAPTPAPEPPPPAEMRVHGLGWWQNLEMRANLGLLLHDQSGFTFDTNAIEDGTVLILTELEEKGYLQAKIDIIATPADGPAATWTYVLNDPPNLPRPFSARAVEYRVTPGLRSRVALVELEGLQALSTRQGLAYFQDTSAFVGNPWQLAYSPGTLRRMEDQLINALRKIGYADAQIEPIELHSDNKTGAVSIRLRVIEGAKWMVTSVAVASDEKGLVAQEQLQPYVGRPWSELLEHDLTNEVRNAYYHQGYPDVVVQAVHEPGAISQGIQPLALRIVIKSGPQIRINEVRFTGAVHTRPSLLQHRVGPKSGSLLDPAALEDARLDLARLGSLQSVELSYEAATDDTRDPLFTILETQPWESSIRLGYGSFEKLRAGFEVRHFNFLGTAGQGEFKIVYSANSARGDLGYSFPELFSHRIESAIKGYALRREELQMERRESGLSVTFTPPLKIFGAVASAGYSFDRLQFVQYQEDLLRSEAPSGDTTAASLNFNLSRDLRDNLLRPRTGYRWSVQTEFASPVLGGASEYQRVELGFSYHRALAQGWWIHVGFTHGVVTTFGANAGDLPVNKLFFPGGDNSIRGYRQGEASPRTDDGSFIGARSYAVLNLESEFALSKAWSLVVFSDSLGTTTDLANYPFDSGLFSVGAGVRFQSIVGPIRLEYGYNLNPRPLDPSGTLLFSLGFPF